MDEHEIEFYLMPAGGLSTDMMRIIFDRRLLSLIGVDEAALLCGYREDQSRFRFILNKQGLRIVDTLHQKNEVSSH